MRVLSFAQTSVKTALCLCACTLIAATADGKVNPVFLGEVTTPVDRDDLPRTFRETVKRELDRVDLSSVSTRDRFVLSAALVQMSTEASEGKSESTAVVSATLRRERGGDLTAIIRGRARATDSPAKSRVAERSAMRAAVRSALERLPEAIH